MKKVIGFLLALVAVFWLGTCNVLASAADEAMDSISLNEIRGLRLSDSVGDEEDNPYKYLLFKPEETGWYAFYSLSDYEDTCGELRYFASDNGGAGEDALICQNDDGVYRSEIDKINDFWVYGKLEAGKIYRVGAKFYQKTEGVLPVCVKKLNCSEVEYDSSENSDLEVNLKPFECMVIHLKGDEGDYAIDGLRTNLMADFSTKDGDDYKICNYETDRLRSCFIGIDPEETTINLRPYDISKDAYGTVRICSKKTKKVEVSLNETVTYEFEDPFEVLQLDCTGEKGIWYAEYSVLDDNGRMLQTLWDDYLFTNLKGDGALKGVECDGHMTVSFEALEAPLSVKLVLKNAVTEDDPITGFVKRLYLLCLDREADEGGLAFWKEKLLSKEYTGAYAGAHFFLSDEFTSHNYSDEDYLEHLYNVMMGRESDEGGKQFWGDLLKSGVGRQYVLQGFIVSPEFGRICEDYGIERGVYTPSEGSSKSVKLSQFVGRLYNCTMKRSFDIDGINFWCEQLYSGKHTVTSMCAFFYLSDEFKSFNTDDLEYLNRLYATFFGRTQSEDPSGFAFWLDALKNDSHWTRENVLYFFINSPEFSNIKAQFGL
ncbi:MAG: DUF4214 domain-containing protein [Lachnospiraceae bacterium]|nr:DUF4214 domain-containing protein [Lachnospiraceae bacterium]